MEPFKEYICYCTFVMDNLQVQHFIMTQYVWKEQLCAKCYVALFNSQVGENEGMTLNLKAYCMSLECLKHQGLFVLFVFDVSCVIFSV